MLSSILRTASRPLVAATRVQVPARAFAAAAPARSEAIFNHRDTSYNNPKIPFKLNDENLALAKQIIAKYPPQYKKAGVIPILEIAQKQNKGWTSISVMNYVAELLEMPPMRVYEVATFYTMFNREPVGEHFVQICTTTPCMLGGCGSDKIVDAVTEHLGVGLGHTTADNKFTVIEVECLGACSNAPMMQINDAYFEDLTPETATSVLKALAAGQTPKPGPQGGDRIGSEPRGKWSSLLEDPPKPSEIFKPEWQ